MGTCWLGLGVPCESDNRAKEDERAPQGLKYGIHETDEPHSIGRHALGGCIRMAAVIQQPAPHYLIVYFSRVEVTRDSPEVNSLLTIPTPSR